VTAELLGVEPIPSEPETSAPPAAAEPLPEPAHGTVQPPKPPSEDLSPLLAELEERLPGRIERVLARDGALVVVLDRLEDEDQAQVAGLSDSVPVALVDQRSWAGLCLLDPSLGSAPVAGA